MGEENGRGWEDEEAIAAPRGLDPVHTRRLLRGVGEGNGEGWEVAWVGEGNGELTFGSYWPRLWMRVL